VVTGFQQLTGINAAAVALTVPAGTREAWLQAEGTNVRYRVDGVDPTASVGGVLVAGAPDSLMLTIEAGLYDAMVIGVDADSILNVHYFG